MPPDYDEICEFDRRQTHAPTPTINDMALDIMQEGIDLVFDGFVVGVGVVLVHADGQVSAAHSDGHVAKLVYGTHSLLQDLMDDGAAYDFPDDDETDETDA